MLIPMKSLMLAGVASLAMVAGSAVALPSLPQPAFVPMVGLAPVVLAAVEGETGEDGSAVVEDGSLDDGSLDDGTVEDGAVDDGAVDDGGAAGGDPDGGVDEGMDEGLVDPLNEEPVEDVVVDEGEVVDGGTDGCIDCSGITSVEDGGAEPEMVYDGATPIRGTTEVQRGDAASVSRSSGGDSREANDACLAKVGKSRAFLCMN